MNKPRQTSIEYCQKQIVHFSKKASHNKAETLWCFRILMGSTLLVPLFITLGAEIWLSKIIPSLLSALAAFCTAWIQLRKPQELWTLYRTVQRNLEDQLIKYEYKLEDYEGSNDLDKTLAQNVSSLTLQAHQKWTLIAPNPDNLNLKESSSKTTTLGLPTK